MGGGSNHWYHGDLIGRAYALLAVLTGNVGRSGGGFSVYVGQYKVRVVTRHGGTPTRSSRPSPRRCTVTGRTETMHETVPYPKSGFKALVATFSNFLLQSPNLNQVYERLAEMELFVVVDHQMTETAAMADVVLPRRPGTRSGTSRPPRCTRSCSCSSRRSNRSGSPRASSRCGRRS